MGKVIRVLALCAVLGLVACKESTGYRVLEFKKEVKFEELPEDVKIPSKAWDLLEQKSSEGAAHGGGGEHGGGHGEASAPTSSNIVFSEVTVFLVDKNPGIINGESVKIVLPKGGGTVDLARFVTGKQGSFFVGFEFPEFEGSKSQKVLFVSDTRKRRIDNQIVGAGCNQVLDITEKFFQAMKGEGLKVNTTRERYISVLGGTFLFSAKKDKETHVAQVTFTQSEHKNLFCEEP